LLGVDFILQVGNIVSPKGSKIGPMIIGTWCDKSSPEVFAHMTGIYYINASKIDRLK